jgi:hypothetical protein
MLAFACWDIFSPLRDSAFLAVGLPALCPDHNRVITFRMSEKQPGWVPSVLRGPGVFTGCGGVSLPLSQITAFSRCDDLVSRSLIEDSLSFTRPVSPLPGDRIRLAVSLGFNLCFTP